MKRSLLGAIMLAAMFPPIPRERPISRKRETDNERFMFALREEKRIQNEIKQRKTKPNERN